MAEEPQYSNKRKYDESPAPTAGSTPPPSATRRPTGFSSAPPVASHSPDSNNGGVAVGAYNSVAPPADEIQLAKQRAQEIAARLFSSAEAKRPRVENGGSDDGSDKGFGSSPADLAQKYPVQQYSSSQGGMAASLSGSYGYHGTNKKIEVPNGRVGVIIGKSGETIKYLQHQSGAKIQVTRDMDADPNSQTRMVELMGTPEQISRAEQLINDVLSEVAEAGGSGGASSRRFTPGQAGAEQFVTKVPNNKVGLIIGKGGETIKNMQARSGARIQVIPLHLPPGDTSTERTVQIDGTQEQIDAAKQLVDEVCSENRVRNTSMGGGYTQQGYRPPRPPTSWGPPGMPPMQQPGYGYMQPGAYPGPPPQYNTSQPPYGGYPSQATSGWDQSTPQTQQNPPSGEYDYYNQQASQQQQPDPGSSAPGDNTSYNYGQPPAASYSQGYGETNYSHPSSGQQHGYGQDGYGGYHVPPSHTGYGPPPTSQPNYDPSQGYSSAGGYPNQDPSAPSSQQAPPPVQPSTGTQPGGYTGQLPSTTTPSQGTTQAGYGIPPTSQPGYGGQPPAQPGYSQSGSVAHPGYGQPPPTQKPPTAQPGYPQGPPSQASYMAPSQPGYPHTQAPPAQSSYGQPDPAVHRGPPGYGSAAPHSSYGQQQPYGAPPAASQTGYQQQQPQPYGDSYGSSAYTQPSAYSSDNPSGGSAHGGYDGTAAPSVQSGVAKTSPKA